MAQGLSHSIAAHEVLRLNPSFAHFFQAKSWLPVSRMSFIKPVSALYSVFYTVFNSAMSKRLHTGEEEVHIVVSQTYNNLISIWIIIISLQSYRLPL